MKILRVMGCPSYNYGSQERYLVYLSQKCRTEGHSLYIIYENIPANKNFVHDAEKAGAHFFHLEPKNWYQRRINFPPLNKLFKHWYHLFDITSIRSIQSIIKRYDIDIVHSYFSPSHYAVFSARLQDKKTVTTSGNPFIQPAKVMGKKTNFLFYLRSYLLNVFPTFFLDKQICLSKEIFDEYSFLGVPKKKLEVITPGCDTEIYNPNILTKGDFRKEYKIKDNEFIIGFTGRLEEQKNLCLLLKIFRDVSAHIPNSRLVIVGDGSLKRELINLSKDFGIFERTIFTGRKQKIKDIVIDFDVFVIPSFFEGMPSSLLEAMSLERACIVSNIDIYHEVIEDSVNGYLCSLDIKEDFVGKIIDMYNNSNQRSSIGKEARKTVVERFHINTRADKTLKLYESIMR